MYQIPDCYNSTHGKRNRDSPYWDNVIMLIYKDEHQAIFVFKNPTVSEPLEIDSCSPEVFDMEYEQLL